MRFALDACVPAQLAQALRRLGADVVTTATRPAMPDSEVLDGAVAIDRVLITSDKDFGDLVFNGRRRVVGVILVRIQLVSDDSVAWVAKQVLDLTNAGRGQFTVIDVNGIRARDIP